MKVIAGFAVLLSLAACATPSPTDSAATGQLVCTRETQTGSLLANTRCRTPQQIEEDRIAAKERLEPVRSHSVPEYHRN